jgi:hypothetical protein
VRCREIKHEAWQQTRIWDARERLGGLTRECAADGGADGWAGEAYGGLYTHIARIKCLLCVRRRMRTEGTEHRTKTFTAQDDK